MKNFTSRQENVVYLSFWLLIIAAPVLSEALSVRTGEEDMFRWHSVLHAWVSLVPFLLAFLLHNWVLAPLLVYRRRRGLYAAGVALLIACFTMYECTNRPPFPLHHERRDVPPTEARFQKAPPRPPLIRGQHDVVAVIVLVLMIGVNLGTKYYYRHRESEDKLKELERQNLAQQLAYLRYQVNPHFLMNTLNNIHALVDLDPEKAQTAIVELSRLLRYAIYDAERESVPFQKEVGFLNNYFSLMRIRYSDQVEIQFDVPSPQPTGDVPPLIFASFVENAFKHGVSYRKHSFVHASFREEQGRLHFCCINSRNSTATPADDGGGLGLRNVRRRLELLFPDDYHLDIQETDATYAVRLDIPLILNPCS